MERIGCHVNAAAAAAHFQNRHDVTLNALNRIEALASYHWHHIHQSRVTSVAVAVSAMMGTRLLPSDLTTLLITRPNAA
jgi:hypothetical protein